MKTWMKWAIGVFVLLVIVGAIAGGGEQNDSSSTATPEQASASTPTSEDKAASTKKKADGCGARATDDCTPHLAPNKQVRVDALYYKVLSARTTKTLGDQTYGLGAKADGRFVVVKLRIRSDKDESATLSGDSIKLEVNGNTYDTDLEGTTAAIGADEEPIFLKDLGPDSVSTGTVVFDVPKKVLADKPELRFNELGFGSTHGYIALPSL
jgi:hypothetical protein